MKASRIVKGLRAIGVDDTTICDFINYYAYGTSVYLDKLKGSTEEDNEISSNERLELRDENIRDELDDYTLKLIPDDAAIYICTINEVEINNIDNPILDGIYRCEYVCYTDKFGADFRQTYLYKDSKYISKDNRDNDMLGLLREDPNIDLYMDARFVSCEDDVKDYYICQLIRLKQILKNYSVREYCTFNEWFM